MSDRDAFLSAIAAAPDDDLPRLVYADFLDEHGEAERAEFIRVQIELARLPVDDPRRVELVYREQGLLAGHKVAWGIPGLQGVQEFRRGFVEYVRTPAEWLIAHPDRLDEARTVRNLRIVNAGNHGTALARLPGLERIKHLDLQNTFFGGAFSIPLFFDNARLDRLTALSLGNCRLWDEHLTELARSPVAPRLRRLALWGCPFGDEGAAVLADSPTISGLEVLDISAHDMQFEQCIHGAGAVALAESAYLTRLRDLDLSGHYIGDSGLIALVGSPNAQSLERLAVPYNDIGELGDSGIMAVVESPYLGHLRELEFGGDRTIHHPNRLAPLGAKALAAWPHLERMRSVDLRGVEMSDATQRSLRASRWAGKFIL
jgi:uncharacterized protein (TIGR02996 family)